MKAPDVDLEVPEVSASPTGTVVLELSPSDAQVLARVLAHYDVLAGWEGPDGQVIPIADGFVPEVWHHTLIRLLAEAQNARLQVNGRHVALVPFRRPGAHT